MINAYNFTKRMYQLGVFLFILTLLFLPCAKREDVAVYLSKLLAVSSLILCYVFAQKFKGAMLGVNNAIFITFFGVLQALGIVWYFFIRNVYFPVFGYYIAVTFEAILMYGALYLDNDPEHGIFKYSTRTLPLSKEDN